MLCFLFATIVMVNPLLADERQQFDGLGLGQLQPIDDNLAMQVRGLSANAYSYAMFGSRAFGIDPNSGATFNATVSNYSKSAQDDSSNGDNGLVDASSFAFGGFSGPEGGPLTFAGGSEETGFSFQLSGSGTGGGTAVTTDGLFSGSLQFGFTTGGFTLGSILD
ncbi:MAG TPA: hypothetical protein DDZ51_19955 [Planctomycetaceae bacterium]|nr:hypothetical protein [Planctomycetaceae bacterium]